MSEHAVTDATFGEIVELIAAARQRAVQAVNSQLIELYWQVGAIISRKIASAEWGDGVIPQLAAYLAKTQPGLRGFTRPNLFRMRQFFEAYPDGGFVSAVPRQLPAPTGKGAATVPQTKASDASGQIVSALLRQLPWTHHLIILGQCKRPEEREFYLRLAVRERWSSRELERQLKGALFERTVLHPPKASQVIRQTHAEALSVFKDAYLVEFLDLPAEHAESDLHRGLLLKLKDFPDRAGPRFLLRRLRVSRAGRRSRFRPRPAVLPPGPQLPGRHRAEGRPLRARIPRQAQLLPRSPGPRREEAPREPAIGVLLCASKDRGGRRIRLEPHAVPGAHRRIPGRLTSWWRSSSG
jgi:predicted nuclease of restriction endonuclease-like (RecB) superfamily